MTMARSVGVETLDVLAHDDPAARRSRRDLARINRVMRSAPIVRQALRRALPAAPTRALRLAEIGCGDGRLMLDVARAAGDAWCGTSIALIDRQPIVEAATVAGYAALGWHAETRVCDVFEWAAASGGGERYDGVVANLFLHHFEGDALGRVLAGCAARADALAACEPRRSAFALAASRLVGFIGANAVTRGDAVLSVRAGFAGRELTDVWQASQGGSDHSGWQVSEYDDGLFTHCFCASRHTGHATS